MSLKASRKKVESMYNAMRDLKEKAVFVGLPSEKVGGRVYGTGMTIIRIGAIHEFGAGAIPRRSFLRVPFQTKRTEVNKGIAKEFEAVTNGRTSVKTGLGRIGVIATQISKGAFTSKGYGAWPDIADATKKAKGSSQPLIDTGILRSAISWAIR